VRLRIMHSAQWWARITDSESGIPSRAFLPFPFFTVRDLYHHNQQNFRLSSSSSSSSSRLMFYSPSLVTDDRQKTSSPSSNIIIIIIIITGNWAEERSDRRPYG
jgi:hypothetical protein